MFLAMPSITLSRHLPVFIRITDKELSHCNRSLLSCSIGPHALNLKVAVHIHKCGDQTKMLESHSEQF